MVERWNYPKVMYEASMLSPFQSRMMPPLVPTAGGVAKFFSLKPPKVGNRGGFKHDHLGFLDAHKVTRGGGDGIMHYCSTTWAVQPSYIPTNNV